MRAEWFYRDIKGHLQPIPSDVARFLEEEPVEEPRKVKLNGVEVILLAKEHKIKIAVGDGFHEIPLSVGYKGEESSEEDPVGMREIRFVAAPMPLELILCLGTAHKESGEVWEEHLLKYLQSQNTKVHMATVEDGVPLSHLKIEYTDFIALLKSFREAPVFLMCLVLFRSICLYIFIRMVTPISTNPR